MIKLKEWKNENENGEKLIFIYIILSACIHVEMRVLSECTKESNESVWVCLHNIIRMIFFQLPFQIVNPLPPKYLFLYHLNS